MSTALVIGEALVDIVVRDGVPRAEHPGGSPMNVAIGLARQGVDTALLTAVGDDRHGRLVTEHLAASGVRLHPASRTTGTTSTAEATIESDGAADYRFDLDWRILSVSPDPGTLLVHTGSIASVLRPGRDAVAAVFADPSSDAVRSFDPNVRAGLIGDREDAVAAIDVLARRAQIVKLSDEDAAWLLPGASNEAVLDHFAARGAALSAITLGADGAVLRSGDTLRHLPAPAVDVVDTIGAGDAFMAGLLAAAVHSGVLDELRDGHIDPQRAAALVDAALRSARITVARAGANPPWAHELHDDALAAHSG